MQLDQSEAGGFMSRGNLRSSYIFVVGFYAHTTSRGSGKGKDYLYRPE